MARKKSNVHFKVINLWLGFVLLVALASNQPHQDVPILSWINCSLYFFIFLQCLYISRRDVYNKAMFLNLAVLCLVYSLSVFNLFVGDSYAFGNDYFSFYIFQYRKMLLSALLAISVLYICSKYLLDKPRPVVSYGLTLLVIVPVFIWQFWPYLADKNYLLTFFEDNIPFYKQLLYFEFLPFFFVCFYGTLLYRTDKTIGEHINTIMVCFFIMILMNITDLLGVIYKIRLFALSQYVSLPILGFFILTLFRKLNYVYSDFGQFYDKIFVAGRNYGVPIKRRKSQVTLPLVHILRSYFRQRGNSIGFLFFILVFFVNYSGLSSFLKLNLIVLAFGAVTLFLYLIALYEKRIRDVGPWVHKMNSPFNKI